MNGFSLLRLKLDEVIVAYRQDIDDRVDDDVGLAESSRRCRLWVCGARSARFDASRPAY
ncbi:MAG: hypothetical protein ACYDGW_04555 [Vulcanimicrobiaceae bacterium]